MVERVAVRVGRAGSDGGLHQGGRTAGLGGGQERHPSHSSWPDSALAVDKPRYSRVRGLSTDAFGFLGKDELW